MNKNNIIYKLMDLQAIVFRYSCDYYDNNKMDAALTHDNINLILSIADKSLRKRKDGKVNGM